MSDWQPIETAPKDGKPIVGLCRHEADPYIETDDEALTLYAAHCEVFGHAEDGPNVVVWGGGIDERSYEEPNAAVIGDWWFVFGSDFERPANPTHWMPLPEPPTT